MFIYYILIVALVGFAIFENNKNRNWLTFMAFLLIFFIFSFRSYEVGSDTLHYINEYLLQTSELRNIDYGFNRYNELLYDYGFSARQYLVATSFLICFPVFFFIQKVSEKKILTYILYITIGCFVFNLSGIRQSLAISCILVGYIITLYVSSIWIKIPIIIFFTQLATQFHASAIFCLVFVPMLWVSQKHLKLNLALFIIFTISPLILPFTGIYEFVVNSVMIYRYENYEADSSRINVIAYFVIPYLIFFYLSFLKYLEKQSSFSPKENFAYLCSFMYVVSAAASFYIPILNRMEYYFSLPMLSLIPTLTSRFSKSNRITLLVTIVSICTLYFFIGQTGGIMRIDNYKFSFDL